jgi:sugar lactone lactonase YvrE
MNGDFAMAETIVSVETDLPANRFNDGKCDPAGRFWIGTMSTTKQAGDGSLYRLETDLRLTEVLSDVTVSNGMCWTADTRYMYYIDSPTREILRFDYEVARGELSGRRVVYRFGPDEGVPDGMTIDEEEMLWVAEPRAWRVSRIDPTTGTRIAEVRLPVAKPTSCCFGGGDLRDLYITTASERTSPSEPGCQPPAGGLFRARLDVAGARSLSFAG